MMRPTINEESDCLRKKNLRRRRPNFLESLIVGDEAAFAMNGEVCTHNVRQYAQKGHPPEFNFERNASREKLHIWGLTFSIVMLPVLSTSGCGMNSFFRN